MSDDAETHIEYPVTENENTDTTITHEDDVVTDAPVTVDDIGDANDADPDEDKDPPGIDPKKTPFIKMSPEQIIALYEAQRAELGADAFTTAVYTEGTYENILHNLLTNTHAEADRELKALNTTLSATELKALAPRKVDPTTHKTILGARSIGGSTTPGDFTVSGPEAFAALMNMDGSGSIRAPLFNSAIAVDLVPTTNADLQNFLLACMENDRFLGSTLGIHYYAYSDLLVKQQALSFVRNLISNTSMAGWNKGDTIWDIIKLPDFPALIMWLAHVSNPEGFDGFIDVCTSPRNTDGTPSCTHTETVKVSSLVDMIRTRWAVLDNDAVSFMIKAMQSSTKMTVAEVQAQQKSYGFDGMTIEHDDCIFTMEVPSITKHMECGSEFLSAITNEVAANNEMGAYARVTIRYMSILAAWVKTATRVHGERRVSTNDRPAFTKLMEMCDDRDRKLKRSREESLVGKIEAYINKVQLTWIGYASVPCPDCGYVEDTPSGLKTVDPLATFFTIAAVRSNSAD